MVIKKTPMRKCLGCNESKPKKELVRVLRTPQGVITIDKTGKQNGRGAYICNDINCLLKAKKTKAIERALEVEIPEELFMTLQKEFSD